MHVIDVKTSFGSRAETQPRARPTARTEEMDRYCGRVDVVGGELELSHVPCPAGAKSYAR